MKSSVILLLRFTGLLGLCLASLMPAYADGVGTRIAFVSSERILREANVAQVALKKIENEFSSREKALKDQANQVKSKADSLDKEALTLSDAERTKRQRALVEMDNAFQLAQRSFREELNQRRNEEIGAVLERANAAIKQIAVQDKYDVVIQEGPVYVSPNIDITDKVLKIINSGK